MLLLGAFAVYRKETISLTMSVRLPVRPSVDSHWTDFNGI